MNGIEIIDTNFDATFSNQETENIIIFACSEMGKKPFEMNQFQMSIYYFRE